ncbi:tetratricopeptide repeat protein [Micromonospora sp. WMMC264]|uniref:tetratricopeptide repeat protein n=1 Tax=Micromonospora sp. WMMC264 TaxID=3015158 RepID=UPI00248D2683|nr:tetratricopeptide repeat protein [Micromonospora sp. WMMC264]WBB88186.1 tetratricopeptide repeat protein [Micromonospora sp. WMMC264]
MEPTPRELAETLWLATQISLRSAAALAPAPPGGETTRPPLPDWAPPEPAPGLAARGPRPAVEAHVFRYSPGETRAARLGEIPKPIALGDRLAFQRALRPLKRRVTMPGLGTLDEEATARCAAEQPVGARWPAVMLPPEELWLDVVLLVDDDDSMAIWQDMAHDIVATLRESGVFRQVARYTLGERADGAAVLADGQGDPMSPRRLVDPGNRRLVIVISDCVGSVWQSGAAGRLLRDLAERGPVAILQPLPERLWARTGAPTVAGTLRALRPCAPNAELGFVPFGGCAEPEGTLIPVLQADSTWLRRWTTLIAGGPPVTMAVTGTDDVVPDDPSGLPEVQPTAEQRIRDFRAVASRQAFQLARYVALGTPQLEVIRYVQHDMFRPAHPAHLAEFLLSGLLQVEDSRRGLYRFVDGVPELLAATLTVSQTIEAEDLFARVSAAVQRRMSAGGGRFTVLVPGDGDERLAVDSTPFAAITDLGRHQVQQALGTLQRRARQQPEPPAPQPATPAVRIPDGVGVVQTGDYSWAVTSVADRPQTSWPVLIGVLPPLTSGRQPRPADQALAAVGAGETAVVVQILSGMGGIGKTQIAANLAHRMLSEGQLDLLIWITATDPQIIVSSYARAAAVVSGANDADPQEGAARLLSWLTATTRRWLIVFDNLDDPQHLNSLWPPATRTGRTVVTTRRRDAALLSGRHVINVDVFTPQEARAYLTRQLGDDPARLEQADRLAAELGHLPLALAQAAAYIVDQGLSCAGYLDRLARRPLSRLHPGVLPDQQLMPVAHAWTLSIAAADMATSGRASLVLRLASVLDPHGIPMAVFTTQASHEYYRQDREPDVDPDDVNDALRALHRLSLATTGVGDGQSTLRIHAVIQRIIRENILGRDLHRIATTAADALVELWPDFERDPGLGHYLRANATALISVTGSLLWRDLRGRERTHPVLFRTGASLGEAGLVAGAHDYYADLRTNTERLLGPDHPDTLLARSSQAFWQGAAGDAGDAATAFEQLLADQTRILGPDHPDTLLTRANGALWRGEAGDADGAAAAFERLLADQTRILGPDHPDTLSTRNRLARWRGESGDAAGAVVAFEALLSDFLRVLGHDHPRTLTVRSNLAFWRGQAGGMADATAAFEQLLADQTRILGPDHPDTLSTRHNLAFSRGEAGDAAGAAAAFEQLLADQTRILGPDHPDTLAARSNYARWRGLAGDAAGAAAEFGRLLIDRERILGVEHPYTVATREALASWRQESLTTILRALEAGVTTDLAVVDVAYRSLMKLIVRRVHQFSRRALKSEKPGTQRWAKEISRDLANSGATEDQEVQKAARDLLALLTPRGREYDVRVSGVRGVQIGDHNRQINIF